jgi:hypothetical protein
LNSLTWLGEVFYRRLLNRVDDFGRYTAVPALLRAALFPLQLEKVSQKDIDRLLTECERVGLLFLYDVASKKYLVMNKWEKGRAKESDYPVPPADLIQRMQTYVYTGKHKPAHAPDSDSDSDSDNDSDPSLGAGSGKTAGQLRAEALFHKRPTTPWDRSELTAWKAAKAVVEATTDDDWKLLEWWFSLTEDKAKYRRKTFATLLNNWNAEIQRAKENHGKSDQQRFSI